MLCLPVCQQQALLEVFKELGCCLPDPVWLVFSLILVASEAFEDDNCSNFVSEDDSETQSLSSFSSGPTSPSEPTDQFPAVVRPGSLDLPSPVSLSEFGMMFPVLGPRSECSGASSPECEVERGELQPSPRMTHTAFAARSLHRLRLLPGLAAPSATLRGLCQC